MRIKGIQGFGGFRGRVANRGGFAGGFAPLRARSSVMPTFQFEAMDATGQEIKDVIDAPSQDEAQATIRRWATSSRRSP